MHLEWISPAMSGLAGGALAILLLEIGAYGLSLAGRRRNGANIDALGEPSFAGDAAAVAGSE